MRFLILFVGILASIGCQDPEAPVTLKVEVKNSQGQEVSGAQVKINGQLIGETDENGMATIETNVVVQHSNRVEIIKQSRSYYYAPYFDSFVVQNDQASVVPIQATMYFVPKPEVSAEDSEKNLEATTSTLESEPSAIELASSVSEENSGSSEESPDNVQPQRDASTSSETPVDKEMAEKLLPVLALQDDAAESASSPSADNQPELTVFTVHVYSAGQPLPDADVYVGDEGKGSLKQGCKTNPRGRCILRYEKEGVGKKSLVVSKEGYVTITEVVDLVHGGKRRFDLARGTAIEIFAMENRYRYKSGIKNAEVFIRGQRVGLTNAFGHLTYTFAGKKNDLVDIVIKAPGFLPTEFEADFVLSEPISIIRYFTPEEPRPVRMALVRPQPAGQLTDAEVKLFGTQLNNEISTAINKHIYRTPAFTAVQGFEKIIRKSGLSLGEVLKKGWQNSEIKGAVDAVILPTVVAGEHKTLELSIIGSRGEIIVAGRETLDHLTDASAIELAVSTISAKLRRQFPYEGAVIAKNGDSIDLNFGSRLGIDVRVGDHIDVTGTQVGEYGKSHDVTQIATLEVNKVLPDTIETKVVNLVPRATIRIGDAVTFRPKKGAGTEALTTSHLRVRSTEHGRSITVAQANVYMNEKWLGATDNAGRLYLTKEMKSMRGVLRVVKRGFSEFSREMSLESRSTIDVSMEKEQAFLTVDSVPSDAKVFVDGNLVGKTPLTTPTLVPTGFVKLELRGSADYKVFTKVVDLQDGQTDFTGGKRIVLERDYEKLARSLREAGRFHEAVERLKSVPESHSDYLSSQHLIGEIYLMDLGEPALAAGAFANVTSHPAVQKFIDKRFIGSHVNEGIALFEAAERLRSKKTDLATAHYAKAAEVLGRVSAQLRFVPEDQYNRAVSTVGYHHALALHKLWFQTKQPDYLSQAYKTWRAYLDSVGDASKTSGPMLENAKVFMKHAEADLNKAESIQ